ncbi:hypothetical protein OF83DRAFT_1086416, partial [Amylostereum chailletii]
MTIRKDTTISEIGFDPKNTEAIVGFRKELLAARAKAKERLLQPGHAFDIPFPGAQDVSWMRVHGGTVWLCAIEHSQLNKPEVAEKSLTPGPWDKVIAKFIQPSMLHILDVVDIRTNLWRKYYPPAQLVRLEQSVYQRLRPLQGGCIPRFYGAHEVTTPSGEKATMLLTEYVEGCAGNGSKCMQHYSRTAPDV